MFYTIVKVVWIISSLVIFSTSSYVTMLMFRDVGWEAPYRYISIVCFVLSTIVVYKECKYEKVIKSFLTEIINANGKYGDLNGHVIVADAYKILNKESK